MPIRIRHGYNHFTSFDIVKTLCKCFELLHLISVIIIQLLSLYDVDVISTE